LWRGWKPCPFKTLHRRRCAPQSRFQSPKIFSLCNPLRGGLRTQGARESWTMRSGYISLRLRSYAFPKKSIPGVCMNLPDNILLNSKDTEATGEENPSGLSRRSFFKRAAITGATSAVALGGLVTLASALDKEANAASGNNKVNSKGLAQGDLDILIAAEIAEALAVTTYSNIINTAPFFTRIPQDDQGYLQGALQEEMSHYLLEQSVTGNPTPFTSFFYPFNMFSDAQTTLNTLVTLEDAFIGAYSAQNSFSSRRRASWALKAITAPWLA
jgi:hypothetical protein